MSQDFADFPYDIDKAVLKISVERFFYENNFKTNKNYQQKWIEDA